MFRKANEKDLNRIAEIYDEINTQEEAGKVIIGWVRDIYPTKETAREAIALGDMFVEEDHGEIVAAGRINQEQLPEYAEAKWSFDVPENQVMVLHTLVVSPFYKGNGYGSKFVGFYEQYAWEHGCPYLRIDTNEKNKNARALYHKLGYTEVSIVKCSFNGIRSINLVCLEKKLVKSNT